MRDDIENNPRLLVIVLLTGVVAVVIFAIYMLAIVWFPSKSSGQVVKNEKLGNFTLKSVATETVLNKYCVEILNNLYSGNMDLIYNMVLPEYLSYTNTNKSKLESVLKQKGLIANSLRLSTYRAVNHPKYGKVFEVTVSNATNTFNDKILIIQKSPNDFKISLDGFIGVDATAKNATVDGLKLDILEIKEQTTVTTMKIRITNVSGHTIILNKGNSYENIYLSLTGGSEIRTNSTWLSGVSKELTNGYVVNLDVEFLTSDLVNGFRKSLVLKDVYDTFSKETKSIEYTIN